jgi:hypothetical protein
MARFSKFSQNLVAPLIWRSFAISTCSSLFENLLKENSGSVLQRALVLSGDCWYDCGLFWGCPTSRDGSSNNNTITWILIIYFPPFKNTEMAVN